MSAVGSKPPLDKIPFSYNHQIMPWSVRLFHYLLQRRCCMALIELRLALKSLGWSQSRADMPLPSLPSRAVPSRHAGRQVQKSTAIPLSSQSPYRVGSGPSRPPCSGGGVISAGSGTGGLLERCAGAFTCGGRSPGLRAFIIDSD